MQSQYYPQPIVETSFELEQSFSSNLILDLDVTIAPDEHSHKEYLIKEDNPNTKMGNLFRILSSRTSSDADLCSVLELLLLETMSIGNLGQS